MKTLREIVTTDSIYVDGRQDVAQEVREARGFEVTGLPCADYAWVTGDKLVALEEKKPKDLQTSLQARRLPKQLRAMLKEADVVLIGLRATQSDWDRSEYTFSNRHAPKSHAIMIELARWNNIGGIGFLPAWPESLPQYLKRLRNAVGATENNLSIIAGSDKRKPTASTPFQRGLKRLFDGVGDATAAKLESSFIERGIHSLKDALPASAGLWKQAGAHRGIIKQLEQYQ